jgi:hypothetical protein
LAVESSCIGGGGRASARLPRWLDIRIAGIGGVSMAFRTATSRRAGAGILGTLAVLLAAALATGQPGPVLAATPVAGGLPTVVRYGTPGISENRQILAG